MTQATLTERLAELQSWRYGLAAQITQVRDFLRLHDFMRPNTDEALADAMEQVSSERVTAAFVGDSGCGKSALINALFFADTGRTLLPNGANKSTRCVTELRFDRDVQTCVQLLPIESRESPKRFAALREDSSLWRSILFDADSAESTARALAALSETKRITLTDAVAWGLHRKGVSERVEDGDSPLVDVPRWRYAIINLPHPLLDAGLVIIDTPGLGALESEPELARELIPDANALVLVLDIAKGVTKIELDCWHDYGGQPRNLRGRERREVPAGRLIVLNKIDQLPVNEKNEAGELVHDQLKIIDQAVHQAAESLQIDPIRVVPVSAHLAISAKFANDRDSLIRSRLYQLERSIATNLPQNHREEISTATVTALSNALEAAQAELDNDRFETLEGLRNLGTLREKNEKIASSVISQTSARHDLLEAALRELKSIKNVHTKLGDDLAEIVNLEDARKDAERIRTAIAGSKSSGVTSEFVRQYFARTRQKLFAAESKIEEIRDLFGNIGERMQRDFALQLYDVHPFATQRFQTELQKAEVKANEEFIKASNLRVRRASALTDQFDEIVGGRVIHIFEIASRETATWMRGLMQAIERPLEVVKHQTLQRSANVEKFKVAELDLAEQIAAMQARLDVIKRKHQSLATARASLERFADTPKKAAL